MGKRPLTLHAAKGTDTMPGTDQVTRPVARRIAADQGRSGVHISYRESLHALNSKQKTAKGAPAYSRFVNRRLGRYLAAAAYQAGLTPNVVTALSGLSSFAAIAVLALFPPTVVTGVLVAIGLVLGYALDSADGQLARLQGGGSRSGEWLDHMIDAAKISSLHLAVLIGAYRFIEPSTTDAHSAAWLLVPIGFTLVAAVSFFGMILNDQLRRVSGLPSGQSATTSSASLIRSLLVIPTDYGVLCLIFLLLGSPVVFFGVYTLLFAGSAGYLLLACVKWFRDMRALDAPRPERTSA